MKPASTIRSGRSDRPRSASAWFQASRSAWSRSFTTCVGHAGALGAGQPLDAVPVGDDGDDVRRVAVGRGGVQQGLQQGAGTGDEHDDAGAVQSAQGQLLASRVTVMASVSGRVRGLTPRSGYVLSGCAGE